MSAKVSNHEWHVVAIILLMLVPNLTADGQGYGGGVGEPNDPYRIYTPEQMNEIGLHEEDWDRHFVLMADVDLGGLGAGQFNLIGRFAGVFDGNDHTISNLTYAVVDQTYAGLFAWLADSRAQIKNVLLIDPLIDAGYGDHVGALIGYLREGTVTNCHVLGGTVFATQFVGGLVGSNIDGVITNCSAKADVGGSESVGGLVGMNFGGRIASCCAAGSVLGTEDVGGLVGLSYGDIENCYADCQVTGRNEVGGLVGRHGLVATCGAMRISMRGTVSCCYSVGQVMGENTAGGLVGSNDCGDILNCFWDVQSSQQPSMSSGRGDDSHVCDADAGRTTAQLQTVHTYLEAGWDFVGETENGTDDIWWILEGQDYPRLWWEVMGKDER